MTEKEIYSRIEELTIEQNRLIARQNHLIQESQGIKLREELDNKWVIDRVLWDKNKNQSYFDSKSIAIVLLAIPLLIMLIIVTNNVNNIITFDMAVESIRANHNGIVVYNNDTGTEYVLEITESNTTYDFEMNYIWSDKKSLYFNVLSSRQIGYNNIDGNVSIILISPNTNTDTTYIREKYLFTNRDGEMFIGFNRSELTKISERIDNRNG